MDTSFEEAKRCPKCGQHGEDRTQQNVLDDKGRPAVAHMIFCVTRLCKWFDTAWVVQVNADGSIPDRAKNPAAKLYPAASPETESRINDMLERQLGVETKPGGEIRNR